MAKPVEMERRIEEARAFAVEQYLAASRELVGDDAPAGDERTFRLFDRTYFQGLADMAVHIESGGSIAGLVETAMREMRGYRSGVIETGVLHIHPVGLDLSQVSEGKLPSREGGIPEIPSGKVPDSRDLRIMSKYLTPEVMQAVLGPIVSGTGESDPGRGSPAVNSQEEIDYHG